MGYFNLNFNYSKMYPSYFNSHNSVDQSMYSGYYNHHSNYNNYGGYQQHGYYNNNQYGSYYNTPQDLSNYTSNNSYRYSYSSDNLNKSDYYDNNYRKSTCVNCEEKSSSLSKTKPLTSSCANLSQYNNYSNSSNNYASTNQLSRQLPSNYSNSYSYNNLNSNSYSNLSYDNKTNNNNNYNYSTSSGNNYTSNNNLSSSSNSNNHNNNEYQIHSNYETTLNDYYKSYSNKSSSDLNTSNTNLNKNTYSCSHHCSNASLASNNCPTATTVDNNNNCYSSNQNISTNNDYSKNENYYNSYYDHSNYQAQKPTIQSTSTSNLRSSGSVDQLNSNTKVSLNNNNQCEDGYTCSDFVPLSQANVLDTMFSSNTNYLSNQDYKNVSNKVDIKEQPEILTTSYAKAIPMPTPDHVSVPTSASVSSVPANVQPLIHSHISADKPIPVSKNIPVTIKKTTRRVTDIIPNNTSEHIKPKITNDIATQIFKENPNKSTLVTHQTNSGTSKSMLSFKESTHLLKSPFKAISEKSSISSSDSIPSFTTLDNDESLRLPEIYSSLDQRDSTFGDFISLKKGLKYGHSSDENSKLNTDYLSTSDQSSIHPVISYKSEFKGANYDFLDKMVNKISDDLYSNYKTSDVNGTSYQSKSQNSNLNQSYLSTSQITNSSRTNNNDRLDLLLDQLVNKLATDKQKKTFINHNNNNNQIQYTANYENGYLNSSATNTAKTKENYNREFKSASNYDSEVEKFYANRNYSIYDTLTSKQSSSYLEKPHLQSNRSNLNLSNYRSSIDWKSLGLLSSNDSKSSSGYTNELFGSNRTPDGIPIRDLIESRSSYSNKDNELDNNTYSYSSYSNNDENFSHKGQTKSKNGLYNYGSTYKINDSKDLIYKKKL
jgi:hypothetical protein